MTGAPDAHPDALDRLYLENRGPQFEIGQSGELMQIAQGRGLPVSANGWLTRSAWNRGTPFLLHTPRLTVRPLLDHETQAFARLIDDPRVARMLVNLPSPISASDAIDWWRKRRFTGRPGFQIGVFDHAGRVVGSVGLGALSNALVYFIGEDQRRRGYASEIIAPFCQMCMVRWDLDHVFAGVFCDNPESRLVLERSGFLTFSDGVISSLGRKGEAEFWEMRLMRK